MPPKSTYSDNISPRPWLVSGLKHISEKMGKRILAGYKKALNSRLKEDRQFTGINGGTK